MTKAAAKWISNLHADLPACLAARRVLRRRVRAVIELAPLAAEQANSDIEHVHQLRVATRRAAAAIRIFRDFCDQRLTRKLATRLRRLRRAASRARQDDVHAVLLGEQRCGTDPAAQQARDLLLTSVADSRRRAQRQVRSAVRRHPGVELWQLTRRLTGSLRTSPDGDEPGESRGEGPPYTLAELAARALPELLEPLVKATSAGLRELEAVHRLRIAFKKLRYALEVFADCLPPDFKTELYPKIEDLQERLGRLNDLHEIVLRIECLHKKLSTEGALPGQGGEAAPLAEIAARLRLNRAERGRAHRAFLEYWESFAARQTLAALRAAIDALGTAIGPGDRTVAPAARSARVAPEARDGPGRVVSRRIAAIDVGTNSVRMVVAETDPSVKFRIIEDIKDTTRLGGGLYEGGRLDPAAIDATCASLERMRRIADGHRVERLRAVGTSALREARNAGDLLRLARERCGVEVEVISAEYEARLAFSSVANAFNVENLSIASVDLGGGSTEIVFSSNGLLDRLCTLPLGGVRLSDLYADRQQPGEYRFAEMLEAIDRAIGTGIGRPPYPVDMLIGTGGTFTTLARVSIRSGARPRGDGRFPFAVRGYEVSHREVSRLVARLRRMPLEERRGVPGMSSRRAEIIVAGLAVIERLMTYLRVDRLRVHDGGIRDGLLLEMIEEMGLDMARSPDAAKAMLASVRGFAERVRYDRIHSEHVSRLALRIFDQLAALRPDAGGTWDRREVRDLLHVAGILHDVGIRVSYARHHRHSYDMIVHADLPLLSRREIEIVANIARYHRRRGPRGSDRSFRRLGADDQRLVAHLAGILRIADGLDRAHLQSVSDVTVKVEPDAVVFEAIAEQPPDVDLRGAQRKAGLFEAAFHAKTRFDWSPAARAAPLEKIAQ